MAMTGKPRKALALFGLVVAVVAAAGSLAGAAASGGQPERSVVSFGGIKSVTKPSRDAVMGFTFPTEVREVLVAGGDPVAKGALLVRARDGEAQALVKLQAHRAVNDQRVKSAENELALAQLEFDRISRAHDEGAANEQEFERSKASLESARINAEIARLDLEEQRLQLERLTTDLERFRLEAPFDGIVESVVAEVGLATRDGEKILRVVSIDPLWIDVPTPTDESVRLRLAPGAPAWVLLPVADEMVVAMGKVTEVSPVADGGSGTRRVRVELPNPDLLPAGMTSHVRFTEPSSGWSVRASAEREP